MCNMYIQGVPGLNSQTLNMNLTPQNTTKFSSRSIICSQMLHSRDIDFRSYGTIIGMNNVEIRSILFIVLQ